MGISPLHGSHAAAPNACDAFNARTKAGREYHYPVNSVMAGMMVAHLSVHGASICR